MATNHQTYKQLREFHSDIVEIDGYASISGADGSIIAASVAAVPGKGGIKEPVAGTTWADGGVIAKDSTGVYSLTLAGKYLRLLSCSAMVEGEGSAAFDVQLGKHTVLPATALGSQKLIFKVVASNSTTGAAVAPTIEIGIRFHARLKNK